MASDQFMLTRPFYMSASDVDFSVDIGGGPVAKSCTVGTYGCIEMLMYEWERLLDTVGVFNVSLDSTGHIVTERPAGNFQITAIDPRLQVILGYDGANQIFAGGASSYTADYTPLYCWFPTTIRTDRSRWTHVTTYQGKEMVDGAVCGVTYGDLRYQVDIELQMEERYLLYRSAHRTTAERDRCLDTFVWGYGSEVVSGCCDSWPTVQGQPPQDGFYFWPDFTAISGTLSSMGAGNAEYFDLTSGATTYAWCQADGRWLGEIAKRMHSIPVRRDYYDSAMPIHTVATVPTWVTLP